LPPEKPARQPQIDEPPVTPGWVWATLGLLTVVFLVVGLSSPSKIAELEKREGALKQQQDKLKQQEAELEKQRAQLSVSSPPSDAEKLSGYSPTQDIYTNSIGMKFKLIKAGKFKMGSEKGRNNEKPVHSVEITKDFYMGVYEVTVGQYKKYLDEKGGYFNPDWRCCRNRIKRKQEESKNCQN